MIFSLENNVKLFVIWLNMQAYCLSFNVSSLLPKECWVDIWHNVRLVINNKCVYIYIYEPNVEPHPNLIEKFEPEPNLMLAEPEPEPCDLDSN